MRLLFDTANNDFAISPPPQISITFMDTKEFSLAEDPLYCYLQGLSHKYRQKMIGFSILFVF